MVWMLTSRVTHAFASALAAFATYLWIYSLGKDPVGLLPFGVEFTNGMLMADLYGRIMHRLLEWHARSHE